MVKFPIDFVSFRRSDGPYDVVYSEEIDRYVNKSKKFSLRNVRAKRTWERAL